FALHDKDGDGHIDLQEFEAALEDFEVELSEHNIHRLMKDYGTVQGTNRLLLSADAFLRMMLSREL
ncbi:hypothetical protein H2199_009199, partial [Coniosporium tulheliwenetii]